MILIRAMLLLWFLTIGVFPTWARQTATPASLVATRGWDCSLRLRSSSWTNNALSQLTNDCVWRYEWDGENRLKAMEPCNTGYPGTNRLLAPRLWQAGHRTVGPAEEIRALTEHRPPLEGHALSRRSSSGAKADLPCRRLWRWRVRRVADSPRWQSTVEGQTTFCCTCNKRLTYLANSRLVGQITFRHGTNVMITTRQYDLLFDDIGNRSSTKAGGDQLGAGLRSAAYTNNALNQITGRGVPGAVDVIGVATPAATVAVSGSTGGVHRLGDYFKKALRATNSSGPQWLPVGVTATSGGTNTVWPTGYVLVPPTGQTFLYAVSCPEPN